jgi:hypothetical protein
MKTGHKLKNPYFASIVPKIGVTRSAGPIIIAELSYRVTGKNTSTIATFGKK